MIILVDNYDSFSYNLYQYVGALDPDIRVVRNDALTVGDLAALEPDHVILSPGPGYPKDAGICEDVVRELSGHVPILGVCLGHQAICEAFGAAIGHAKHLMHGKQSRVSIDQDCPLFTTLPGQAFTSTPGSIDAARYHSLSVMEDTLPECLQVVARADDEEVMAVQHVEHPTFGLQFHPESIMTPDGMDILRNFLACDVPT
jgi:anthranilate synthase component 2